MLRSMTGFGKATGSGWIIEIKSLNRRHLEVIIHGQAPEVEVRAWVQKRVQRGRVSVAVSAEGGAARPNLPLLKGLKASADEMAEELGLEKSFCFQLLVQGVSLTEVPEAGALRPVVEAALEELVVARDAEGRAMAADLLPRLQRIATLLKEIEERAGAAGERIRARMAETLPEIEMALLIERSDFTEEVTRFDHHLATMLAAVEEEKLAAGRKLDFLCQELLREVNTIGAKAQDVEVSDRVIEIKTELERVREQIQNVE